VTYRNRALLDLCHEAPCCLQLAPTFCGNNASSACHSDMIRHGRAVGHKSHDCFAVPGCPACHIAFTRENLGKEGYHAAWTEAMERYILWLWVAEKIQITARPNAGKEKPMEAPLCRICGQRHWAREPHIGLNPTKEQIARATPSPTAAKIVETTRRALAATVCPDSATAGTTQPGSTSAKRRNPAGTTRTATTKRKGKKK